jgi:hypothetical protein
VRLIIPVPDFPYVGYWLRTKNSCVAAYRPTGLKLLLPSVKAISRNTKLAAGVAYVSGLFCVFKYLGFATNIRFGLSIH